MSDDRARQLAQLRQAHEQGILDEDTYNTALAALNATISVQAEVQGPGAVAQQGGIAAGAGGVAARQINAPVTIHNEAASDPSAPDPASLRRAYLNRVYEQAGTLSLAGIDPKAASEAEARLHLGAVYTALLTQSTEAEDRPLPGAAPQRRPRPLSAVEQLNRQARLVLLGDPGSGKSTFVNFVALCLAGEALSYPQANLALLTAPLPKDEEEDRRTTRSGEEEPQPQPWSHGTLLPVRVVLRDFAASGLPAANQPARAAHLWKFIASDLERASLQDYAPFLRQALLDEGGLLLLDGLDEVPEAGRRRTQIKDAVADFAASFPRCRILVTSRTYAYQQQDWRLPNFGETLLAPFSPGQIRRFVTRWYTHIGELRHLQASDAQGRAELLIRAIFASDRLAALAERPLLLTLMASLHAWRGGSLPEKREELYADAVELLLDWWESQRVVRDAQGRMVNVLPSLAEWLQVDRDRVRSLLNELAYKAHAAQPSTVGTADITEADLIAGLLHLSNNPDVKPRRLLDYLSQRAGILVPRGVEVYTFPHRTFQEYLAACYLTDHDFPDDLAGLARTDPDRWREVVLLAGAKAARGTAAAIWSLAEALCFRMPDDSRHSKDDAWGAQLAGQALLETANLIQVSERNQSKVERIRQGLVHIIRGGELPALERALAGRTLARLGDPRPEVMTIEGMQFCFVPAGPFWMGSRKDEPLAEEDEQPQHRCDLAYPYWIGRYPVTNAQFQAFVRDKGYVTDGYWPEAIRVGYWQTDGFKGLWDNQRRQSPYDYGEPLNLPNHPVVGITWYEALAFTRWLATRWQQAGLLPDGRTVRLPSEAEWEKAARGGLDIPVAWIPPAEASGIAGVPSVALQRNPHAQRRFPWGDTAAGESANYDDGDIGVTSTPGCFAGGTSPYGVEELSGNVWEWTRSLYESYPYPAGEKERQERENLETSLSTSRVLRGGAYYSSKGDVRCAYRYGGYPRYRFGDYGFRVVVSPFISLDSGI